MTRRLLDRRQKVLDDQPVRHPELVDIGRVVEAGWDEEGVNRATALVAFFNYSGRLETGSGLPPDAIPDDAAYWKLVSRE